MSAATVLARHTFETSRAAEYFDATELQAQTGQPASRFAAVACKELVDNALDAAESHAVAPAITIAVTYDGPHILLSIEDNGAGIPPETIARILNFETRTSDKSAYRTPTRGQQGNALKTVFGIPHALGVAAPVVIEARGVRHTIAAGIDPAGALRIRHTTDPAPARSGTRVELTLPVAGQDFAPQWWARASALFNPHASVKIRCEGDLPTQHAYRRTLPTEDIYQPVVSFPDGWRKFLPTDLPSPHWYDARSLARLIFAHIAADRTGAGPGAGTGADTGASAASGRTMTLRDFVRHNFRGLSASAKAKAVCDQLPHIGRLSDFERDEPAIATLLATMQTEARPAPPGVLGLVGADAYQARFATWYGVRRFWYRKAEGVRDGVPFLFEVAVAETERPGDLYHGINFSPTFGDPFARTPLRTPEFSVVGLRSFLYRAHAVPRDDGVDAPADPPVAVAVHLVCPALTFLDRGKTQLEIT